MEGHTPVLTIQNTESLNQKIGAETDLQQISQGFRHNSSWFEIIEEGRR